MALALRRIARAMYVYGIVRAVYAWGVRNVGRRFTRFAFGSVVALATSEITLVTCLGVLKLWPTISAALAWFSGAAVSYVLSRWAWERTGRPHLLKETLPFWLIALGTIVFLSSATSLAHHLALSMGLKPVPRLAFVGAAYLVANTVTFLTRFVIFHYVLFADRRGARTAPSGEAAVAANPSAPAAGPAAPSSPDGRPSEEARRSSRGGAEDRYPEASTAR